MSWGVRHYRGGPDWEYDVCIQVEGRPDVRERKKTRVSSYSGSVDVAKKREQKLLDEILHPRPVLKEVPVLRQFWDRYVDQYIKAENQRAATEYNKLNMFKTHFTHPLEDGSPAMADLRLDAFRAEHIQRFKKHLLATMAVPSANRNLLLLHHILTIAVVWKVITELPCRITLLKEPAVRMIMRSQYYDFDEYERLRRSASREGLRCYLILLLGGDAGLRLGEMRALRRMSVDLAAGRLSISENVYTRKKVNYFGPPKGGVSRTVPMTRRLRAAFAEWFRAECGSGVVGLDGFVLNPGAEEPIRIGSVQTSMKRIQRDAGVRATGAVHILRHTFCSHLAMKGQTTLFIKEVAGHRDFKTTAIYMHLSPSVRDQGIEVLDATA